MVFVNPMIDIAGISLLLALASQLIQERFIDRKKMKKMQEGMKERQKKMQELVKKQDQKSKNELEALQSEMMESMQGMLSGSTKVMVASLVLFIPALWAFREFYEGAVIQLPIPLPWFADGLDILNPFTWFSVYPETNWFGWYFVSYLAITLVINGVRKAFDGMEKAKMVNVNG